MVNQPSSTLLPVIALAGRPNVGKSTLFNYLTHSRNALVSDFPGMTRDRQYGLARVNQQKFIVIDTGGITDEDQVINNLTTQQAIQAAEESDVILFLVDARAGLTQADQMVAKNLRQLNKTIWLIVNKSEGLENELAIAEFYELGFTNCFAISAAHHAGIDTVIDRLFLNIPEPSEQVEENPGIKLAIIGRPNVGKSTLMNRMLGEERVIVLDQPGTTRDSIFVPLQRNDKHYTLIDTAGIRKKGRVIETIEKFSVVKTLQAIEASEVVIMVMDAHEGVTEQDLKIIGFILDCGKAIVIAVNKWDGMSQYDRDQARDSIDRRLTFINFARIHFISALHGTGVGNLFDSVNEAFQSANIKMPTPMLTKMLEKSLSEHSPPLVQGRRIKLRYAHAGGHNPPTIIVHGNQVQHIPTSYKKYLENSFQKKLKLMGTPVRVEFKSSENPFKHKKNPVTLRQQRKKNRLMKHVKKRR